MPRPNLIPGAAPASVFARATQRIILGRGGGATIVPVAPDGNASVPLFGDGVLSEIRATAADPTLDLRLVGALDASDALAYEGAVLPAGGAAVQFVKGRRTTFADAVQFSGQALPTFTPDAGGTHRHGLRFSGGQAMSWPGLVPRFAVADMGVTLAAVVRLAAVPSGLQTIFGLSVDGAFQDYRQTVRLKLNATGFQMNAQTGSGADTLSAIVASAPAADATYILVGRHGPSSGDNFNKLAVRAGGATLTANNATTQDLDFNSTGAMTQALIGAHRRGGTLKEFLNGWLLWGRVWDRELTDTEVAAEIADLRGIYGVA